MVPTRGLEVPRGSGSLNFSLLNFVRLGWRRNVNDTPSLESSVQSFHEIAAALASPEVLTSLFGSALKPNAGIACSKSLNALIAAAAQFQRGAGVIP